MAQQRGVSREEEIMPRYVWEQEDGERVEFESDEELEIDEDDDDDEADDDEESGDGDEEPVGGESAEQYALVEAFYKAERAAIRRITEASELRLKRQSYEKALRTPNPSRIGMVRVRDLLELVEQRELDLRAKRLADRGK
jgi:hypothetical protein